MGLANYYRKSVLGFSTIAHPINLLTKKGVPWHWGADQELALEVIKEKLTSAEVMSAPDFTRPFIVQTDWSKLGMGAILAQLDDAGVERVVAYASKTNTMAEGNYSSYKGEMAAAVWAIAGWRRYLAGRKFTLVTDHQPLNWLRTSGELSGQHARWALKLQDYLFNIIHRPGTLNPNADALSRQPDPAADTAVAGEGPADHLPPAATEGQLGTHLPDEEHLRAVAAHYQHEPRTCAAVLTTSAAGNPAAELLPAWRPALALAPGETAHACCMAAGAALFQAVEQQSMWLSAAALETQDIWEDVETMQFIKTGQINPTLSGAQQERVTKRAARYTWSGATLNFTLTNGSTRAVPPPGERAELARKIHAQYGHFGVKRTAQLLSHGFWWPDMWHTVSTVVRECVSCDRNKTGFNVRPAHLNPLPIDGLGFRWHVDLAGPLSPESLGISYVMVCVEAFSKWLELIPIPNKSAATTERAFVTVLTRFGACAVVTTDQGREWAAEWTAPLQNLGIDHRETSRNHPQANGLAERAVQTVKDCIRRTCDADHSKWASSLPWIAMGYNMSTQAALGFAPYHLLYGRPPVIPPAIRERHSEMLPVNDPVAAAKSIIARGVLYQRMMPMALENLTIAQHQDSLRYAQTRTGGYVPRLRQFEKGDFVRVKDPTAGASTLNHSSHPSIFRVAEVRGNGVLVLKGRDARHFTENVENCTPCHLFIPDTTEDPSLAPTPTLAGGGIPCRGCNGIDGSQKRNRILLCDHCNDGWHQLCLQPPITTIQKGNRFCPDCEAAGRTTVRVSAAAARDHIFNDQRGITDFALGAISLDSPASVLATLQTVMPGTWTQAHATGLFHSMPGQRRFLQAGRDQPERVSTLPAEYTPLFDHVSFEGMRTALDPFSGNGSTGYQFAARFRAQKNFTTISSDADPAAGAAHHGNALEPAFLSRLREEYGSIDVIVTSPWFRLLDPAIPILFRHAKFGIFIHVPGHYLSNMPAARRNWFRSTAPRVRIIADMPVGLIGRRCAWVCIFKTEAIIKHMFHVLPHEATINFIM